MASIFEDGVTPVDAALVDKLVKSDGNAQFQIMGFRIYYESGWKTWTNAGNTDAATQAAISISWDNTLDQLVIDMSGLSSINSEFGLLYPACVVSPSYRTGASPATPNFLPQAHPISSDIIWVRFFDVEGDPATLTHQTTIDTRMDFNIIIFGSYDT